MNRYSIREDTVTAFADTIRKKAGTNAAMTPGEMLEALQLLPTTALENEIAVSQYFQNGITTYIYQWERVVVVYWDGTPAAAMNTATWHAIALGLPPCELTVLQSVCISCINCQEYSARLDEDRTLRICPLSGAITDVDRIRGQLVYFATEGTSHE